MVRSLLIIFGALLVLTPKTATPISFKADPQCLANNIYFEARGEGTAGKLAVGQVTLNRVKSDKFPNSICEVVTEGKMRNGKPIKHACQFSWYCDGIPDVIRDQEAYIESYKVATYLLTYNLPDITDGALFFHSKDVNPNWRRKRIATIGRHIFYA